MHKGIHGQITGAKIAKERPLIVQANNVKLWQVSLTQLSSTQYKEVEIKSKTPETRIIKGLFPILSTKPPKIGVIMALM